MVKISIRESDISFYGVALDLFKNIILSTFFHLKKNSKLLPDWISKGNFEGWTLKSYKNMKRSLLFFEILLKAHGNVWVSPNCETSHVINIIATP